MLLPSLPLEEKLSSRPNPVIASMVIDPHMVMIQIQVGKKMVEDILSIEMARASQS
jgi:hypothetical protein